jgi:glycosyltransferase involved in cell wall biosynthesis
LAYEAPAAVAGPAAPADRPFVILFLGRVTLTKGVPYLLQAARLLKSSNPTVKFVIAGPIGITKRAMDHAPGNVEFVGPVARQAVSDLYRQASAFVLPTLSDGFAITQLEAMAHGLPVVITPNCGRVVTDGYDGQIVPPANPEALAAALDGLATDRLRTRQMGQCAMETSRQYSIDRLGDRLAALVNSLVAGQ